MFKTPIAFFFKGVTKCSEVFEKEAQYKPSARLANDKTLDFYQGIIKSKKGQLELECMEGEKGFENKERGV